MKGDDFITHIVAVVFVLLIVFTLICVECVLRKKISYLISDLNADQLLIESRIREIIFLNPKSELIVICTPESPEIATILDRLQKEYPQLHIIK